MPRLIVNGRPHETQALSVGALLGELRLGPAWTLVERNGTPVDRNALDAEILHEGDTLEIIRAVAGG